jgi:hypothetical protein
VRERERESFIRSYPQRQVATHTQTHTHTHTHTHTQCVRQTFSKVHALYIFVCRVNLYVSPL